MKLIYCHHIIKLSKSIFCRLKPFAYLCTHNWFCVISPGKCHQDNRATAARIKPSVRFDRLSHLIATFETLRRRGEEGAGGAGEGWCGGWGVGGGCWICTRLLNLKRCFCAKHFQSALPWKYHFVFFFFSRWERKCKGLSEIEVNSRLGRETFQNFSKKKRKKFAFGATGACRARCRWKCDTPLSRTRGQHQEAGKLAVQNMLRCIEGRLLCTLLVFFNNNNPACQWEKS